MSDLGLRPIDTVRNTIFPAETAARFAEPSELAEHYRLRYPVIRRFNRRGTYFGRLVALPNEQHETIDQLSATVAKLRRAGRRMSSRYELNVYLAREDCKVAMGFPCLSHCALHLDGDVLHMSAQYRNHYLVERGYGNYLGLGELLEYICRSTNLRVGELLVVAGRAELDHAGKKRIAQLLEAARR
jgi:thymidylate synthase